METPKRYCPNPTCDRQIPPHEFVCPGHWYDLSKSTRSLVADAKEKYRGHKVGLYFLAALYERRAEFEFGKAMAEMDHPWARNAVCPGCGLPCVSAHDAALDARILLDGDEGGDVVVVGGYAQPDGGRIAAYARFSHHVCWTPHYVRAEIPVKEPNRTVAFGGG